MRDAPIAHIVASWSGVCEVSVLTAGDGKDEIRLYRALLPAVQLVDEAISKLRQSALTNKSAFPIRQEQEND